MWAEPSSRFELFIVTRAEKISQAVECMHPFSLSSQSGVWLALSGSYLDLAVLMEDNLELSAK